MRDGNLLREEQQENRERFRLERSYEGWKLESFVISVHKAEEFREVL